MTRPIHALAEAAAAYAASPRAPHVKLSISLPSDLVEEIRRTAEDSGLGVSGVVAAALRHSMATAEQARLDRALALDAKANEAWARDALALTVRSWADLEW
jgi:hypothetical protein